MANIIEKQKIWRIQHKFDTVENWKLSTLKLKSGELAFDDNGNFKVGTTVEKTWNELPYAGCTRFYKGDSSPTEIGNSYVPGDMYKDTTNNRWYILTDFNSSGNYVWEEISSSQDIDFVVQNFEQRLTEVETNINELNDKISTLVTQDELEELHSSINEELQNKVSNADLEKIKESIEEKVNRSDLFDEYGIIKTSLLPGSVDDIVEGVLTVDGTFIPLDSEAQVAVSGKLYVDVNTKKVYRWSGSQYISISSSGEESSLVLGTTEGTAFEGSKGQQLTEKVSELENISTETSTKLETQESKLNELESNISGYDNKFNSIDTQLSNQTRNITQITEKLSEHDDKINALEISDASQAKRLSSIEGKLIEQIEKTSSLETSSEYQNQKLTHLEERLDDILGVETPDGEISLGTLAFKDKVSDEDITKVSISKLYQSEEDEVVEFYCGTSLD